MAEQEFDRSEAATPFRLEEARKRGSVARSLEVAALFSLLTLLAVLVLQGPQAIAQVLRLSAAVMGSGADALFEPIRVHRWLSWLTQEALAIVLPLFVALMVVGVIGGLLQVGPIFSTQALKPDLKRLNPVEGFKRLFSIRLLFETGKSLFKLVLFTGVLWLLFKREIAELLTLLGASPWQTVRVVSEHLNALLLKLAVVVAAVAVIDMVFVRWHWMDKLKMSRRELLEEIKHREGDPRIRSRLRELRREMVARARSLRRLPEADVVITNPTHLAVALQYRRESMSAPQLIAKGSGEMAQQMKEVARRHRVPVVENPTLARALFREGAIDSAIPEALYPPVARLLVWVYSLREARA